MVNFNTVNASLVTPMHTNTGEVLVAFQTRKELKPKCSSNAQRVPVWDTWILVTPTASPPPHLGTWLWALCTFHILLGPFICIKEVIRQHRPQGSIRQCLLYAPVSLSPPLAPRLPHRSQQNRLRPLQQCPGRHASLLECSWGLLQPLATTFLALQWCVESHSVTVPCVPRAPLACLSSLQRCPTKYRGVEQSSPPTKPSLPVGSDALHMSFLFDTDMYFVSDTLKGAFEIKDLHTTPVLTLSSMATVHSLRFLFCAGVFPPVRL